MLPVLEIGISRLYVRDEMLSYFHIGIMEIQQT